MQKLEITPEDAEKIISEIDTKNNVWHNDRDFALAFSKVFKTDGYKVAWDPFQDRISKTLILISGEKFDSSGSFDGDLVDYLLDGLEPSDFNENCEDYKDMYKICEDEVFKVDRSFLEDSHPDTSRKEIRDWIVETEKEIREVYSKKIE